MHLVTTVFSTAVLASVALLTGDATADSGGEGIYQHCKNCHGSAGEGGKDGEYPRIAALPEDYIERQINNFKLRKRINKPMVPTFKNWRFDEEAIAEVAAYVSAQPEPTIPAFEPSAERLSEFESRQEFEELGSELFEITCSQCHGMDGRGRIDKEAPPLVNQYPNYIFKQIRDFVNGSREHEHAAKMFGELYEEEVESLLVHLGRLSKQGKAGG